MNRVPPEFLQFCTKHEYFKRNCTLTARENIQQMIDSELLTPNVIQDLPNYYEEEFNQLFADEPRDPNPLEGPAPKRRRVESPERQPEDPDPDSDNSDIEDDDSEEQEPELQSQITIANVKSWYKKFAEMEISRVDKKGPKNFGLSSKILSVQSIVPSECSTDGFPFPFDFIGVQISRRIITLNLRFRGIRDPRLLKFSFLQYWSHEEGCLFQTIHGELRLLKGVKYQHLAAKHFFTLVKHFENSFNRIRISTMPFEPHVHPATWPFRSFYGKVQKHLGKLGGKINCSEFEMHFHKYMGTHEAGVKNLMSILPFLEPEKLQLIRISCWDDRKVFELRNIPEPVDKFFYIREDSVPMEQWKAAKKLEFDDEQIRVADFQLVWGHRRVKLSMTPDDVPTLVKSCPQADIKPGESMEFLMDENFDFDQAKVHGYFNRDLEVNRIRIDADLERKSIRFSCYETLE